MHAMQRQEADDTYTNIQSVTYDQDAVELDDQAKDLISKFLQVREQGREGRSDSMLCLYVILALVGFPCSLLS
jgi:cell fate (sporulation/competence/biofilm development) regulator YlbF (YheA/YmcA/DUF963 family)